MRKWPSLHISELGPLGAFQSLKMAGNHESYFQRMAGLLRMTGTGKAVWD